MSSYIDASGDGEIRGWIRADKNGCPAKVCLRFDHRQIEVPATHERPDALKAGFSLFSGFDLKLTSETAGMTCEISAGTKSETIAVAPMSSLGLIHIDKIEDRGLRGWVTERSGIRTLKFYHDKGISRAEPTSRPDVNEHLGTDPKNKHGFLVTDIDIASIYALNINNTHIHWLTINQ